MNRSTGGPPQYAYALVTMPIDYLIFSGRIRGIPVRKWDRSGLIPNRPVGRQVRQEYCVEVGRAVHQPDVAIAGARILQDNVALSIPVEIARAGDLPLRREIGQEDRIDIGRAVH